MIHSFKDHLPFAEHGFGLEFNHYVSGRIAADVVRHGGISTLYYVGKQGFRRAACSSACIRIPPSIGVLISKYTQT